MNHKNRFGGPKNSNSIKEGFTLIELVVIITIVSILSTVGFDFYKEFQENENQNQIVEDIRRTGTYIARIVNNTGDIPLNYCRNSSGNYSDSCFEEDYKGNGTSDNSCNGVFGDIDGDSDCDTACTFVDCQFQDCAGESNYFDISKLLQDYGFLEASDSRDFLVDSSYLLCPKTLGDGSQVVGKANESEFHTFNPSFTVFYKGVPIYEYNSNP